MADENKKLNWGAGITAGLAALGEGMTAMGGNRVPYYQNYLASQEKRNHIEKVIQEEAAKIAFQRQLRDQAGQPSAPISPPPGVAAPSPLPQAPSPSRQAPSQFDVLSQSGAVSLPPQNVESMIRGSITKNREVDPIEKIMSGLTGSTSQPISNVQTNIPKPYIQAPGSYEWNEKTARYEYKPGSFEMNPKYLADIEVNKQVSSQERKKAAEQKRNLKAVAKTLEQTFNTFRDMRRRQREITGPDVPERVGPFRLMGAWTAFSGMSGENRYVRTFLGDLAQTATALVKIVAPSSRAGFNMVKVLKTTLPDEWSNMKESKEQAVKSLTDAVMRYAAANPKEFPNGLPNQREFEAQARMLFDQLEESDIKAQGAIPGEEESFNDPYEKYGLERPK